MWRSDARVPTGTRTSLMPEKGYSHNIMCRSLGEPGGEGPPGAELAELAEQVIDIKRALIASGLWIKALSWPPHEGGVARGWILCKGKGRRLRSFSYRAFWFRNACFCGEGQSSAKRVYLWRVHFRKFWGAIYFVLKGAKRALREMARGDG